MKELLQPRKRGTDKRRNIGLKLDRKSITRVILTHKQGVVPSKESTIISIISHQNEKFKRCLCVS